MTLVRLSRAGLADVRFGASALVDLLGAARSAFDPAGGGGALDAWWREARAAITRRRFPLLEELVEPGHYIPDIVVGKPGPRPRLDHDLAALAALRPSEVERIVVFARGDAMPPRLGAVLARPAVLVERLSGELRALADLILSGSRWTALRGVAAAEAWERGLALASGGPRAALLDPPIRGVRLRRSSITVDDGIELELEPEREGVWFVPSPFAPSVPSVGRDPRSFTGLSYRPAGVAAAVATSLPGDPLTALAGGARARVLCALLVPRTTEELAEELGLAPATVSEHLQRLKAGGLVVARREGRTVVYTLVASARTLAIGWPDGVSTSD